MLNKYLILLTIFFISGCATNETRISDLKIPVAQIQNAIFKASPNGRPKVSASKRKFTSQPFLYKGGQFVPASNSRIRYIAQVEILGDRRPYTILIVVNKIQYSDNENYNLGPDTEVAKALSKSIQYQLSKSLKSADVIDDFRVF